MEMLPLSLPLPPPPVLLRPRKTPFAWIGGGVCLVASVGKRSLRGTLGIWDLSGACDGWKGDPSARPPAEPAATVTLLAVNGLVAFALEGARDCEGEKERGEEGMLVAGDDNARDMVNTPLRLGGVDKRSLVDAVAIVGVRELPRIPSANTVASSLLSCCTVCTN